MEIASSTTQLLTDNYDDLVRLAGYKLKRNMHSNYYQTGELAQDAVQEYALYALTHDTVERFDSSHSPASPPQRLYKNYITTTLYNHMGKFRKQHPTVDLDTAEPTPCHLSDDLQQQTELDIDYQRFVDTLTDREIHILSMRSDGKTLREIAQYYEVSIQSACVWVSDIKRRMISYMGLN